MAGTEPTNETLERLSWLMVQLLRMHDELVNDKRYLSEEADRWGEPICPTLLSTAPDDSVEGAVRARLEQYEKLRRMTAGFDLTRLATLRRLLARCDAVADDIRNCKLSRLPSNAKLAAINRPRRRISA